MTDPPHIEDPTDRISQTRCARCLIKIIAIVIIGDGMWAGESGGDRGECSCGVIRHLAGTVCRGWEGRDGGG